MQQTDKPVQPLSRRQEALLESIASAFLPDEIIDGDEAFRNFNRAKNDEYPIGDVIASARKRKAREREARERETREQETK
jgi:hypothetical protein